MLRAFWKISFLKIDDEENKALKDIILKRNENFLSDNADNTDIFFSFDSTYHNNIKNKLNKNYILDTKKILYYSSNKNIIYHEMAIEAAVICQISNKVKNTIDILDCCDYISHQVIASPFKPIDYMDKMDIFGYKYIPNFYGTISKYLVIELKKGAAKIQDIEQTLKYVDWINQQYSFGDYSMINAFLIANEFDKSIIEEKNKLAKRNFITKSHPITSSIWTNLKLIKYTFNRETKLLELKCIS
ncbi:hypothetical protein [Clostridium fallax]|uniref:Uncharacterized protein n=1 Tax=Clostridium fallax TaxID=1533 RepID=A0A1M4Z8Y4_9CLOT|nr:hypothetical protein [Clostridium fallax]SHF14267.1 hypothetical protein SAMN05443638_13912 [Clostridium fallax]SQB07491.1 Uncharacterised protein [Clostridium fallax]